MCSVSYCISYVSYSSLVCCIKDLPKVIQRRSRRAVYSFIHLFTHSSNKQCQTYPVCQKQGVHSLEEKVTCLDNYKRRQNSLSSLRGLWERWILPDGPVRQLIVPFFALHSIPFHPIPLPYCAQIYATHLIKSFLWVPTASGIAVCGYLHSHSPVSSLTGTANWSQYFLLNLDSVSECFST